MVKLNLGWIQAAICHNVYGNDEKTSFVIPISYYLLEPSNLTAYNQLLMGIQSISAASALGFSEKPATAKPDDVTVLTDKNMWKKFFDAADGE